jgi:dTDP-4-amino-4,6-dideoxygalactose transaminase
MSVADQSSRRPVPFVDLARQHAGLETELRAAIDAVIARGDYILGEDVSRFEDEFAAYVGAAHAVGVGSGTAAIAIGLAALGIGPGDRVIVPAHTYIASALGIIHAGAEPVLCDVDEASGLIDLESAAAAVDERSAGIMAVHLYGQACDMDALGRFAADHGLALIEDAAQAHGATWNGRPAGSFGDVAAFSFYPSKNLGALGDGGMICARDGDVAEAARRLRNLGQAAHGDHRIVGYNERLDTLQAAALRVKLRHLDGWNEARRAAAEDYRRLLPDGAPMPPARAGAKDVFHLLAVRVDERDAVAERLGAAGVRTGVHYGLPLHRQPALGDVAAATDLTVAADWAARELSLPMFPGLEAGEVERVCEALQRSLANR